MELFYFTKQEELDAFVTREYLQSWSWGEVLRSEGAEIVRLGWREQGRISAAATLVKKSLGTYSYWYAPRGPLFDPAIFAQSDTRDQFIDSVLAAIRKLDRRALFLRIEPDCPGVAFADAKFSLPLKKTLNLQPAQTLLLDLRLSEEELLAAMQPKTRYNIRLAEKKNLSVRVGGPGDFSEWWRLMNLTGERDNFRIHRAEHYEKILAASGQNIKLLFVSHGGKDIAAALFSFYGDTVTYMHGASDNESRNMMAPYLLQWTAIKMARAQSYRYYDFYGIDAQKWPGVTRFKRGFGGQVKEYPGTYDVVFRPFLYQVYELLRRLRRLI